MEKKQEAIKKAYTQGGLTIEQFADIETNIDEYGWVSSKLVKYLYSDGTPCLNKMFEQSVANRSFATGTTFDVRPKSLQGIETNNGWIRIESEEDLPEKTGNYKFLYKIDNRIEEVYFNKQNEYFIKNYSHYKPIEQELLPIY